MLKIREDKMQELEKLGFEKYEADEYPKYYVYYYEFYKPSTGLNIEIYVDNSRQVLFDVDCGIYDIECGKRLVGDKLDIFYELFANDMVEKVDE